MQDEYQGDPGDWLNLDRLRVILNRVYPNGRGETVVNIQGGRDINHFEWKQTDDFFVLTYPGKRIEVAIRILTPDIVSAYQWDLASHHLEEGMGPAFFAAMDAIEGRQVYRLVEREGGVFDSLVQGDKVLESGVAAKCKSCQAFALCPFRLQGCYLTCDPTLAMKVIDDLRSAYASYSKRRQIRPADSSVPQPGERPGLYSYSKRQTNIR